MERDKLEMRRELKALAEGISAAERAYSSRIICARVIDNEEYLRAGTVFVFAGTELEVDTTAILEDALARGKRVCLPSCIAMGQMEARRIQALGDLQEGMFGILAPGADCAVVAAEEIDLAIVPCLSCNRRGDRLGFGGGFYDRFLAGSKMTKVVLCMEKMMREDIPVQGHDVQMDLVVSDWR